MKKITASTRWFVSLLAALLISACAEDGTETLVIEDGQPTVAQMIVGTWRPDRAEVADEGGNVIEHPDVNGMPELNFGEGGTGHYGSSANGSGETGDFAWTVDEGGSVAPGGGYDGEGPSVSFGDERWYIFQLTKSMLIIYRISDGYIIIYYYKRVGDYNGGNGEGTLPEADCPYKPYDGDRIVKIESLYQSPGYEFRQVYSYAYDEKNRITSFSEADGEGIVYTTWEYEYDAEKVTVKREGLPYFVGYFNKEGYVAKLESLLDDGSFVQYDYNEVGYLLGGDTSMSEDNLSIGYDSRWCPVKISYPELGGNWEYAYGQDGMNINNLDLNKVCTSYGSRLEALGDWGGFLGQFDFLGRRTPFLVASESRDGDLNNIEYETLGGRISRVVSASQSGYSHVSYTIYYSGN